VELGRLALFSIGTFDLSYLAWKREERLGEAGRITEDVVYWAVTIATLASFFFFAFTPLPRAYYPEIFFHRPEEFFPAFFFLLALIGYLKKGAWKHDQFEHWLVMSIIVGFMGQVMFMSISERLFDFLFDAAHTLKKVSYVLVLTGLLISMFRLFRQADESARELSESNERLEIVDRIARVVGSSLREKDLFPTIAREIRRIIPCERLFIGSVNFETEEIFHWHVESDVEVPPVDDDDVSRLEWYQELYEKMRPLNYGDIRKVPFRRAQDFAKAGLRSQLVVPIVRDGQCVAHLALSSTRVDAFSGDQLEQLISLSGHINVALQNASHLQEPERRAMRLAALNDMGQKIAGNLELSEVFDRIVHAVAGILKTDYSRIFMIDEKEQELVLRASHGRIPIPPGRVATIKMGESVTGWARQNGESLLVPDVLKNPFWEDLPWEWVPKKEIRALICQPLLHRGKIIGYINGMSRQEGFFTEEDLSTLGVLASQAAAAIENARLFSDTRERATRLEFVGNIAKAVGSTLDPEELFRTIVDEILRVVPCERCVIGKVDQTETPNFSYWHTGGEIGLPPISAEENTEAIEWYIQNVYSRNQTAYLPNLGELETPWPMRQARAGFNSLLAVPILQDGTCIAHFSLSSTRTNAFSGGQVEFLTSVAGHLGSVIRNASLYQTAEERAVRLASLNEVNMKITQNLTLDEVLENVARSAVELLRGSYSRVYLLNEESGLLHMRAQFGGTGAPPEIDAHPPDKGLRGIVFQTGKPVLIQNVSEDERFEEKAWAEESGLRGFIAVPVFHEDRVIGVLNCMGKESVSFSRDDADLLQSLANLGSVAIQNARLFQESEEKGKRLATLVDVAQRLTRELDLASVLKSIAESAASLFGGGRGHPDSRGRRAGKSRRDPGRRYRNGKENGPDGGVHHRASGGERPGHRHAGCIDRFPPPLRSPRGEPGSADRGTDVRPGWGGGTHTGNAAHLSRARLPVRSERHQARHGPRGPGGRRHPKSEICRRPDIPRQTARSFRRAPQVDTRFRPGRHYHYRPSGARHPVQPGRRENVRLRGPGNRRPQYQYPDAFALSGKPRRPPRRLSAHRRAEGHRFGPHARRTAQGRGDIPHRNIHRRGRRRRRAPLHRNYPGHH
jgi:GAF domain-containing protein